MPQKTPSKPAYDLIARDGVVRGEQFGPGYDAVTRAQEYADFPNVMKDRELIGQPSMFELRTPANLEAQLSDVDDYLRHGGAAGSRYRLEDGLFPGKKPESYYDAYTRAQEVSRAERNRR